MVKQLDLTVHVKQPSVKRTNDEMCRWLEKRKRTKALKATDHIAVLGNVTMLHGGAVLNRAVIVEQLLGYHTYESAPSSSRGVGSNVAVFDEEEVCTQLEQTASKLKDRFHRMLCREAVGKDPAESISLQRDWVHQERMQLPQYKLDVTHELLRKERELQNPMPVDPGPMMEFDLSFGM
jgi:hypothetical protein